MLFKNYNQIINNGKTPILKQTRKDILDVLSCAIDAVNPYVSVKKVIKDNKIVFDSKFFNVSDFEDIYLVGFGKASVGMSQAVCDFFQIKEGIVVTNDKTLSVKHKNVLTCVGSHPIPDKKSLDATDKVISFVKIP